MSAEAKQKKATRESYGEGLSKLTQVSGSVRWYARFSVDGTAHNVALGGAELTEKKARKAMKKAWAAAGYVPRSARPALPPPARLPRPQPRSIAAIAPYPLTPTFGAYADYVAACKLDTMRNEADAVTWHRRTRALCEEVWESPVNELAQDDQRLLGLVVAAAARGSTVPEFVRSAMQQVFAAALLAGACSTNPAAARPFRQQVTLRLGRPEPEHYTFLEPADVPALAATLKASDLLAHTALLTVALTAKRRNEVLNMRWSELDIDGAVWTIPKERMKGKRQHVEPITRQLAEVLHERAAVTNDYVFENGRGRPLDKDTYRRAGLRVMAANPHGLRTSFAIWCEANDVPIHLADQCLSHQPHSAVRAAYFRSDNREKRQAIMQRWADYLIPPG